jgi:hypothetical protein
MRFARLLMISFVVAFAGQSCVSMFDLDGFEGVIANLCETLAKCNGGDYFPDCVESAEAKLAGASAEERAAYLAAFSAEACLESCTNARNCLDAAPLCDPAGSRCGQAYECCGFSTGVKECSNGTCCAGTGVSCDTSADCCQDECVDTTGDDGSSIRTCGGVQCIPYEAPCEASGQCCGDGVLSCHVLEGTCLECQLDDSPCQYPEDCCSGSCVYLDETEAYCESQECQLQFAFCDPAVNDCCDGDPICTYVPADDTFICHNADCVPLSYPCSSDGECCSLSCRGGICEFPLQCPTIGQACDDGICCGDGVECGPAAQCCVADGQACPSDPAQCCAGVCAVNPGGGDLVCGAGDCSVFKTDPCSSNQECCDGPCLLNQCCDTPGCNHDFCSEGQALLATCGSVANPAGPDMRSLSCIQDICDVYPDCCCLSWSSQCVTAVSTVCGITCDVVNLPPPQN